ATKTRLPITLTAVGYQPTGMNPLDLQDPGRLTSNTARQLLSALAMYRVLLSLLSATPFVVDPARDAGYSAAFKVSITSPFLISITETLLSFALATKRNFPFFVRQISFGLSPTAIRRIIFFNPV